MQHKYEPSRLVNALPTVYAAANWISFVQTKFVKGSPLSFYYDEDDVFFGRTKKVEIFHQGNYYT